MIEDNDLADEAFEDSSQYEFKGTPLYFSFRHYYALLAILAEAEMSAEEQCLLIFWIATHDPDQIKELRQRWRKNKDEVFDDFEQVPDLYDLAPGSGDLISIAELANKIWTDIENSKDEIKQSKDENIKEDDLPKK